MPFTITATTVERIKFVYPFRIFISGGSGSGKTIFTEKLLLENVFEKQVKYVRYYHPKYLKEVPVDWHNTLQVQTSYHEGLPYEADYIECPEDTVFIIDDQSQDA